MHSSWKFTLCREGVAAGVSGDLAYGTTTTINRLTVEPGGQRGRLRQGPEDSLKGNKQDQQRKELC